MKTVLAGFVIGIAMAAAAAPRDQEMGDYVPTGSHVARKPTAVSGARRAKLLEDFGKCVARSSPAKVSFFLRHSDDFGVDPKLGDVTDYLYLAGCLGNAAPVDSVAIRAQFNAQQLRVWLAEAAYLAAHRTFEPLPAGAAPPPPRMFFASPAALPAAQANAEFSDCIAEEDPAGADKFLRTRKGSREEVAAARAMAPALGRCLQAGQKIVLTPETLRSYAAQGLWQRYEAAKVAG